MEIFFWFSPLLIFYLWHFIFILHRVWIEQVYSKLYTVSYLEIKIPIYSKPIYLMKNLILTESTYCLFANIAHLITATDNLIWCSVIEDEHFKGDQEHLYKLDVSVECDPYSKHWQLMWVLRMSQQILLVTLGSLVLGKMKFIWSDKNQKVVKLHFEGFSKLKDATNTKDKFLKD